MLFHMRQVNLRDAVALAHGNYTTKDFLREFVFAQDWSQDEASVAAYERITEAFAAAEDDVAKLEDRDFQTLCARVKQVQLPGPVSIELGHLRNRLVLKSPKVD